LINEDPYGEGWMFQVRVADDSAELLSAAEYTDLTSGDS
jgi:glycine cleavage system H protein